MDMRVCEITEWTDELRRPARALYERSFPPAERHDFARILNLQDERSEVCPPRILAALEGDSLLGLSIFRYLSRAEFGYLWYLCVSETSRGLGVGRRLYLRTIDLLREEARRLGGGLKCLVFEVERLEGEPHPDYGDPVRRIKFYEGLGARLILGYDYRQPPIPPHGPVPLQLMLHPLGLDLQKCDGEALARIVGDFLLYGQGVEETVSPDGLRLASLGDLTPPSTVCR